MTKSDPKCIPVTAAFRASEHKRWLALADKKKVGKGPLLREAAMEFMKKHELKNSPCD